MHRRCQYKKNEKNEKSEKWSVSVSPVFLHLSSSSCSRIVQVQQNADLVTKVNSKAKERKAKERKWERFVAVGSRLVCSHKIFECDI